MRLAIREAFCRHYEGSLSDPLAFSARLRIDGANFSPKRTVQKSTQGWDSTQNCKAATLLNDSRTSAALQFEKLPEKLPRRHWRKRNSNQGPTKIPSQIEGHKSPFTDSQQLSVPRNNAPTLVLSCPRPTTHHAPPTA